MSTFIGMNIKPTKKEEKEQKKPTKKEEKE